MKKFTRFSLATVAVLGLSSGAYAVTDIDEGAGGTVSTAGTADTLYITNTNGNMLSIDGYDINLQNSEGWGFQTDVVATTVTAEDDIILNADTPDGGAGGVIMQKAGTTLMSVGEGFSTDVNILTNTYVASGGTQGLPSTSGMWLDSTAAQFGYWDATGDVHGLTVNGTSTTLSGGTNSSVLTLTDGDDTGATLTVGGSDPTSITQTVFSATSDAYGEYSLVTVGSALSDSTTIVQGGGADLTLSGSEAVLSSDNDIVLNANNNGMSYGGVIINDVGNAETIMSIYSNAQGGTDLYSTLDMNDNQIHGIAPGTLGTDATNLNQLNAVENDMSGGIAAVTAIANIPQVDQGKTYSLGIGFGHYSGESAFAVGGSWRYNNDGILKASVGSGGSGATIGVGTAMSW